MIGPPNIIILTTEPPDDAERARSDALCTLAALTGARVQAARGAAEARATLSLADLILLCSPPAATRALVRELQPGPAQRIVVASRGFEPDTGARLTDVIVAESACLRVGALAGPLLPADVARGTPVAAVVASAFDDVTRLARATLGSAACRVYASSDVAGVEIAGALVEVLAIALGVARGLELGVGAQAMLVTRGIAEGSRLARLASGDPRTFTGLAGVGELVVCAASPEHPAVARGLAVARGETDAEAASVCAALLAREADLPIVAAVAALASGRARPADVLPALMTRENDREFA
jgi:glycerol-3-phosphate dehydrogenase (NAD(P)+)